PLAVDVRAPADERAVAVPGGPHAVPLTVAELAAFPGLAVGMPGHRHAVLHVVDKCHLPLPAAAGVVLLPHALPLAVAVAASRVLPAIGVIESPIAVVVVVPHRAFHAEVVVVPDGGRPV